MHSFGHSEATRGEKMGDAAFYLGLAHRPRWEGDKTAACCGRVRWDGVVANPPLCFPHHSDGQVQRYSGYRSWEEMLPIIGRDVKKK